MPKCASMNIEIAHFLDVDSMNDALRRLISIPRCPQKCILLSIKHSIIFGVKKNWSLEIFLSLYRCKYKIWKLVYKSQKDGFLGQLSVRSDQSVLRCNTRVLRTGSDQNVPAYGKFWQEKCPRAP